MYVVALQQRGDILNFISSSAILSKEIASGAQLQGKNDNL